MSSSATESLPSQSAHKTTNRSRPPPNKKNNTSDIDITKEEFDRISEALKKEEFRKLFIDYVEEIQDPENRKIYEQEITQLEKERGVDVTFINPEPGFVIKTSQDGDQKCFINCAKSEHVAKPTNQICLNHSTGKKGINWSIPMAQAPPRDDLDNKNKRCRVYDVVFHPDAVYLAERNKEFHQCLVDTALDAVEREYKVKLDRINLKFPKTQFKGIQRPTVIRKLSKNPPKEAEEPHPLESIYPPKPSSDAGKPKIIPTKNVDMDKKSSQPVSEYCTPKYTIKHRRDIDLSEYTNELDAKLNVTVPRELDVVIELPLLNSSNECQLDVTEKTVFLLSDRVGAKYRLNIELPFRVNDKEGRAKFDVDTRRLSILLPVLQQNAKQQREMHESLLHICREDSGVESDIREDCQSNSSCCSSTSLTSSPIVELSSQETSEDLVAPKAEGDQESDPFSADIESNKYLNFLKPDIDYQFPSKFDSNVLDNTLSIVLHTRNVQEQSIQKYHDKQFLHLQFTTIGSGFYPNHYSFYLQLKADEENKESSQAIIENVEVEPWENNLILNINLNQSAETTASFLAGLDSSQLKEYWIYEKSKNVHKSRQRQKSPPSNIPMDIKIERTDGVNKSIEIEIKKSSVVSYNNTTEDEDPTINNQEDSGDNIKQQQYMKKQNKKQKRKNKKRRSLSESACDDIKAYQQQQQEQQQQQQKQSLPLSAPVPDGLEHGAEADDDDDDDDEDEVYNENSGPLKTSSNHHAISSNVNVPVGANKKGSTSSTNQQRNKQRSFSESRDSVISLSAGSNSASFKGILKHYSRYGDRYPVTAARPSISDSCSSIDECSSSAYSTSVDGMMVPCNSLPFSSHSFSDIPEENVTGLSESCKKTVRFSEVIKKQVFRMDSSILGQRKKNQKRRDLKQRALQRRLSEGDSVDYEDNKAVTPLQTPQPPSAADQYLKTKNTNVNNDNNNKNNSNKYKGNNDKKSNSKRRARLESESSSDVDVNKNAMMFEMDM